MHPRQPAVKILWTAHAPPLLSSLRDNLPHKVNRLLRLKYEGLNEAAKFQWQLQIPGRSLFKGPFQEIDIEISSASKQLKLSDTCEDF